MSDGLPLVLMGFPRRGRQGADFGVPATAIVGQKLNQPFHHGEIGHIDQRPALAPAGQ